MRINPSFRKALRNSTIALLVASTTVMPVLAAGQPHSLSAAAVQRTSHELFLISGRMLSEQGAVVEDSSNQFALSFNYISSEYCGGKVSFSSAPQALLFLTEDNTPISFITTTAASYFIPENAASMLVQYQDGVNSYSIGNSVMVYLASEAAQDDAYVPSTDPDEIPTAPSVSENDTPEEEAEVQTFPLSLSLRQRLNLDGTISSGFHAVCDALVESYQQGTEVWFSKLPQRIAFLSQNGSVIRLMDSNISNPVQIPYGATKVRIQYVAGVNGYDLGDEVLVSTANSFPTISDDADALPVQDIGAAGAGQAGIVIGNYLARFQKNENVSLLSFPDGSSSISLPANGCIGCNTAVFGTEYAQAGDAVPVIYLSANQTIGGSNAVCFVSRMSNTGSFEQVQKIQLSFTYDMLWSSGIDSRPYGSFVVDTDNQMLYVYTVRDAEMCTRFFRFRLPRLADGSLITLNESDVLDWFDVPYISYAQDHFYSNGHVYICSGLGNASSNSYLHVIDLETRREAASFNLTKQGIAGEPQVIDGYQGKVLVGTSRSLLLTMPDDLAPRAVNPIRAELVSADKTEPSTEPAQPDSTEEIGIPTEETIPVEPDETVPTAPSEVIEEETVIQEHSETFTLPLKSGKDDSNGLWNKWWNGRSYAHSWLELSDEDCRASYTFSKLPQMIICYDDDGEKIAALEDDELSNPLTVPENTASVYIQYKRGVNGYRSGNTITVTKTAPASIVTPSVPTEPTENETDMVIPETTLPEEAIDFEAQMKDYAPSGEVLSNPLTGYAVWSNQSNIDSRIQLVYVGITWREWEPEKGQYNIEGIRKTYKLDQRKAEGRHVVLRFLCDNPSSSRHMDIPDWLYQETRAGKYYSTSYGSGFAPDYNNTTIQQRHALAVRALGEAFGQDGLISYIELGSLGHWGEWHTNTAEGVASMPSESIRNLYVTPWQSAFPNAKILMRRPFSIAAQNGYGLYNDVIGDRYSTDVWLDWIANGGKYDQTADSKDVLKPMNGFWTYAPSGGELTSGISMNQLLGAKLNDTVAQLRESHTTFIGPNIAPTSNSKGFNTLLDNMGYKLAVTHAQLVGVNSSELKLTMKWANNGVAPMYWNWPVSIFVRDAEGNVLSKTPVQLALTSLLPGSQPTTETLLPMPEDYENCSYWLAIEDPMTGKACVTFDMDTEQSNGFAKLF